MHLKLRLFISHIYYLFQISDLSPDSDNFYFKVDINNVGFSADSPFTNNEDIIVAFLVTGDKGDTGAAGTSGTSGTSGTAGSSGTAGTSGTSALPLTTGSFTGSFTGSVDAVNDFTFSGEVLNVLGNVFVQGELDAATKNFRINHPQKPGYWLMHSSLEGPERGIYYRGKLKTSNTIYLPDYWEDLVDDIDITVQLTPIGNACLHFVESVNKKEIKIGCDCGKPHCFFIVHAQRYDQGKFELLKPKIGKSL